MAVVYQHKRLDTNDIFYIGIELDTDKRKAIGKRSKIISNRNKHWKNIVNKVGYSIEILFLDITNQEAIEIEKYLIKYYGRCDLKTGKLVNLTDGGEGTVNLVVSKETRLKNAAAARITKNKKGKRNSPEQILALAKFNTGNKYCLGKKHSKETKLKISLVQIGKKLSEEHKNKIRSKLIGRVISEENKIKLSELRSIKVIDTSTELIYNSMKDAALAFNISRSYLSNMLNGVIPNITTLIKLNNYDQFRVQKSI